MDYWAMLALTATLGASLALQFIRAVWQLDGRLGAITAISITVFVGVFGWLQLRR